MKPFSSNLTNVVFGPPKDWDEEKNGKCLDLPVVVQNGTITSFWELELEDLQALARGGKLMLQIAGNSMPAVSLCIAELEENQQSNGKPLSA
jgi:hypothetical protein